MFPVELTTFFLYFCPSYFTKSTMIQIKRLLYIITVAAFFFPTMSAQTTETFTHIVKQGETIYSIARTYQVSQEAIIKLNPNVANGIKTGEQIIIPQNNTNECSQGYHTISAGETLYQLTKKYSVSSDEICRLNPGLTEKNFKIGTVIKIPKKEEPTIQDTPQVEETRPKGIANSGCMEMHRIGRKETLFSIATQYNISVEELKEANPEMYNADYTLRRGRFVCIPYPKQTVKKEEPQVEIAPSNKELLNNRKATQPKQEIRMGVLLPFKGSKAESAKMLEFYRGILMAADSIKTRGISVSIYTEDSGKTPAEMQQAIDKLPSENLDFIIGPLHQEQIPTLSNHCRKHNIRMIVPFSSTGEQVYQNPFYYAVNAPKSFLLSDAADLTMELFRNGNFIICESNENDKLAQTFTDTIALRLSAFGSAIKRVNIEDNTNRWLEVMSADKTNIIIPNSSSIRVLNQIFPQLNRFSGNHPEYKIKLIGYPEWQTYTYNHLESFYRYDTYAYSAFYKNPLSVKTHEFEALYQKNFNQLTLNSYPNLGMFGFDITYFFLYHLSTFGDGFEETASEIPNGPFQHGFKFRRISNWSGFINHEVKFIHYTPEFNIELIRLK